MEAHSTLGCIQDQNSWGWVLQITTRSCVNFSVLTALFLHSFGGNRTGLLGLEPCVHLTACQSWLFPVVLWRGNDCSPHFTVQSNTGICRQWGLCLCGRGCLTQDRNEAVLVCEDPYPKAQDHGTQDLQGEGQSMEAQKGRSESCP